MQIFISVRNFVEFLLREGDIDNRRTTGSENALLDGSRIHRLLQSRMGKEYTAEVSLRHVIDCERYQIVLDGRADGIIRTSQQVIVDEIKGTYRELKFVTKPVPVHLAQAKCYAYIYALQNELSAIGVRMTYCNMDTEEIIYFHENLTFAELKKWFDGLVQSYRKWADFSYDWKNVRTSSAKALSFPFVYREGQKELAGYVYTTLVRERKLFIQAPTGVGKTISTIFPAVKAIGEQKAEKLFYLTAKTITRTVAKDAFDLLRKNGLSFKTVILTAKEKICFCEEAVCNPDACPYAKGHFDRINEAIYELLTKEDDFNRETIEEYAGRHQVCPFEMALDMSLFADAVICDYNYLFDPYVYLRRFFTEGAKGDYYFLIDEAHNLVDRGREMYSAGLVKEDFLTLKKLIAPYGTGLERYLNACNKELLALKKTCDTIQIDPPAGSFAMALSRLHNAMNTYLEEHEESPVKEEILQFYFEISRFLDVYERMDENYVTYTEYRNDGSFFIKEYCVNPATRLEECMERGKSSILFSATFLPIQYYKSLLGGTKEDYEVYAKSTFAPEKRGLFIGSDVTSRYTRRGGTEYYNIAAYLSGIVGAKRGNYLIFFPSHKFLEQVYEAFMDHFYVENEQECIVQREYMDEKEREAFLERFRGVAESEFEEFSGKIEMEIEWEERSLIGFCVLGGIFGEGIDLKHDSLIGAVIVGTGLPQVCNERELIRNYFEEQGKNGFDYAYRYPGMNKVLQAAGRVIRTAEDIGIVALLDERFLEMAYQNLFPREWKQHRVMKLGECRNAVCEFWERALGGKRES
ncbi:MAG: ATP-dependent DNA helicase [Lachnospiraceae bacterium]|nr:ATP-dependent DNA helicase [Lachnospiraceae bacterium]